jgi:hypothetical protein
MARVRPAARALLEHLDDATAKRLGEVDEEFAAAFAGYQRHYGCRALRYEVAEPTLAESPTLVLGLVRDQLARDYDPEAEAAEVEQRRAATIAQARSALAAKSSAVRCGALKRPIQYVRTTSSTP